MTTAAPEPRIDIVGAAVDFPIFDAKTRSLKKAVLGRAGGRIGTDSKVPIIASLTQLLFFMTPIVWSYERLKSNPLAAYVELNPVMHFVEIVRQPLLGQPIVWRHWAVVGVITVVGCTVALLRLRNYRSRVAYWV